MTEKSKSTVYRIEVDTAYSAVTIKNYGALKMHYPSFFAGIEMKWNEKCPEFECEILVSGVLASTFFDFPAAAFAFKHDVTKLFTYAMGYASQYVPLALPSLQGEDRLFAANVTNIANAFDKTNSTYSQKEDGTIDVVSDYVIRIERIAHSIFKIPQFANEQIFAIDRDSDDQEQNFIATYQANNCTGLKFVPVFESDT